jgi:outer membrane lipoprotein-sorting protein
MSLLSRRPALRWLAPAAVVVVIAGGGLAAKAITTGSAPAALPTVTAAELLADIRQAKPTPMSGTVVESADLGIPDLPGLTTGKGSDNNLTSLISGTHTLRVWYGGPTQQRLAVLNSLGESDVIRNGTDLWMWDSSQNSASHRTLPAGEGDNPITPGIQTLTPTDPQSAAQSALAMIDASTTVTVKTGVTVAGRPAYELSLAPKSAGSLISAVRIAVDGTTYMPLQVQVDAVGGTTPAFSIGFTAVDFSAPDAAEFTFTPPPGATVTEGGSGSSSVTWGSGGTTGTVPPASGWTSYQGTGNYRSGGTDPANAPRVVGNDWTSVIVAGLPSASAGHVDSADPVAGITAQLGRITAALPKVSGSWGSGHLLSGTLFSVVITDDQRIAVGAVTPELLYQALGSK